MTSDVRRAARGRRRRGARPWWAACAAAAALVVPGCGLFGPGDHAAFLGDSITDQSRDRLRADLGDSYDIDIRAQPGVEIREMLDDARLTMRRPPDQVIVNLGTNDVLSQRPVDEATADLEELLDQLEDATCVHLVTINELMVSFEDEGLGDRAAALNEEIERIADDRGYEVVDWTEALEDATDEEGAPGMLTDTVHLTEQGEALLAEVYGAALASGC